MLIRTGTGLKLIPHRLNNNHIQFEGYDRHNKHLFTFILADEQTNTTQTVTSSGDVKTVNTEKTGNNATR